MLIMTLLLTCLCFEAGCKPVQFVLHAFQDDRIPARYKLPQGTVLVLVDDPNHLMGDPALPQTVAGWVGQDLEKNVSKVKVVPLEKIAELARRMGSNFAQMPVDQVGSELGATQVVYVLVESVGMQGQPGLYHPDAKVRVNVIDVATGKRVFPQLAEQREPTAAAQNVSAQGEPVEAKLSYTTSDQSSVGVSAVLMRSLAQELGKNIAQLFYKHHPEKVPGYMDE
jgi:hypothetical protein